MDPHLNEKDKSNIKKVRSINRDNSISISNISSEIKWQDLKDLMRKVGDVKYVDIFKNDKSAANRGLVEFKDRKSALKAYYDFNGHKVNGRSLIIQLEKTFNKDKDSFTKSSHSLLRNTDSTNSVVHVFDIPGKINWTSLRDFFISAGEILRVDIVINNKNRPMGVIIFKLPIEAVRAVVVFNGKYIGDHPIHVRLDAESALYQTINQLGIDLYSPTAHSMLNNLQQILTNEQNSSHNSAENYGQYNNCSPKYNERRHSNEDRRDYRKYERSSSRDRRPDMSRERKNPYPLPHHSAVELSRISRKEGRQVYVKNLPYDIRPKELNLKFSKAGNVIHADVIINRDGRSKGCGYVIYTNHNEARSAEKIFNESDFGGRIIKVHVDN